MEVYLIRHTAVAVAKGICYGQTDVPLAASFATDAELVLQKLAQYIEDLNGLQVFTSPAQRCTQLATKLSADPVSLPAIQELNFGIWEMKAWDELPAEETTAWMNDFVHQRPPRGESFSELQDRATHFFNTLPHAETSPVLIITHAGPIRSIICQAIGLPLSNAFQLELDYGSVTKLVYRWGLWNLKFLNV